MKTIGAGIYKDLRGTNLKENLDSRSVSEFGIYESDRKHSLSSALKVAKLHLETSYFNYVSITENDMGFELVAGWNKTYIHKVNKIKYQKHFARMTDESDYFDEVEGQLELGKSVLLYSEDRVLDHATTRQRLITYYSLFTN